MFKIIIGLVIAVAIFFKVIVPIWMDLEDTVYEVKKKKEGKARQAARLEKSQKQRQVIDEVIDARKNGEYRKAINFLDPIVKKDIDKSSRNWVSCLYYSADSMRKIAATPQEWHTAYHWAATCRRCVEANGVFLRIGGNGSFELESSIRELPDLILSEGKDILQETGELVKKGDMLMEAGSLRKALEVYEIAAKAGSHDAAAQAMELQLLIFGTTQEYQDISVLDTCLERCRAMGCIEIKSFKEEVDRVKTMVGESDLTNPKVLSYLKRRKERFYRESCNKAIKALNNRRSDEVVSEAQQVLAELIRSGYTPAQQYKAEQGDMEAQLYLACAHEAGLDGLEKSDKQARAWYQKAADNGSGYAAYRLYELTGDNTWLQRVEALNAAGGTAAVRRMLKQTADETPTVYNYPRIQHALALLIQAAMPEPYFTDWKEDDAPSIIWAFETYAWLDAQYRKVPELIAWFEQDQHKGLDGLANLKYIYNYFRHTEKEGPERSNDRMIMVRAINLREIYCRIEAVYRRHDYSIVPEIARLYLSYNKEEAKSWLDHGIYKNDAACMMEAYNRYESYGYDWYDVSRYRDRAIAMGYQPAIRSAQAEAREWEREKDAMVRERYEEAAAERRLAEAERAERRKELDEKLDLAERLADSDGLTKKEQYQLGKRDVYDHVRDELFREALHDLAD